MVKIMRDWIKRNKLKSIIIALVIITVWLIFLSVIVLMRSNSGFNYWLWNDHGSVADWVSGLGTLGALIFAYKEIIDSKRQFNEEHRSELKVYANWKEDLVLEQDKNVKAGNAKTDDDIYLHIVPVNIGLASGIYRYFGICKVEDINNIVSLVEKGNLNSMEDFNLLNLICYDSTDAGQTDNHHSLNFAGMLYPNDPKVFSTIESNSVGEILDKAKEKIEDKLKVDISKDKLAVLYIDPQMKIYSFEVGLYK